MKRSPWKWVTVLLGAALVATTVGRAAQAEPQTEVLMAIGMLDVASGQLLRVKPDPAGRRAKAIAATQSAMFQLKTLAFPPKKDNGAK